MKFLLFSKSLFEVEDPFALIESYCFQSNFYVNYDFLLHEGDRSIEAVNRIGARIRNDSFSECKEVISRYESIPILGYVLEEFLRLDTETRELYIADLSQLVKELDEVRGIGFSKVTKILHTLRPRIIPMIDSLLQKEYIKLEPLWKYGDWKQILIDYYTNFDHRETYENVCELHTYFSFLSLTKVRIFDILWWSFLKADALRDKINWTTIRRLR